MREAEYGLWKTSYRKGSTVVLRRLGCWNITRNWSIPFRWCHFRWWKYKRYLPSPDYVHAIIKLNCMCEVNVWVNLWVNIHVARSSWGRLLALKRRAGYLCFSEDSDGGRTQWRVAGPRQLCVTVFLSPYYHYCYCYCYHHYHYYDYDHYHHHYHCHCYYHYHYHHYHYHNYYHYYYHYHYYY